MWHVALLAFLAAGWKWQYALARFHFAAVKARHRRQEVWSTPADATQLNTNLGDAAHLEKPYVTYHVD
jgi:hypothetical protein